MPRDLFRTAAAVAVFGLLHSALASRTAKEAAARVIGERNRNGLYRVFYNAQAVATTGLLVIDVARRPGRELYHVRGPGRWAMHAGQAFGPAMMFSALRRVGIAEFSGLKSLAEWWGDGPVSPGPEAQGPSVDAAGRLWNDGPFRLSRHPVNAWAVPVLWLWPRMTTTLLAFNVAATLYLVIGSRREERRLLEAYGKTYGRYLESGTPFFAPRFASSTPDIAHESEGAAQDVRPTPRKRLAAGNA